MSVMGNLVDVMLVLRGLIAALIANNPTFMERLLPAHKRSRRAESYPMYLRQVVKVVWARRV